MKTGYIQIFSEQAAKFHHPKDYNITASVKAFEFAEVPEWVMQSRIYKLLVSDKKIRLIEGKKDVAEVESANGKISRQDVVDAIDSVDETEATEENEIDYSAMKAKQLYDLCLERGIEAEKQQSREYYINLLN